MRTWQDWLTAKQKQLDAHFEAGTLGKAVRMPTDPQACQQVFRGVWNRLVKANGVRKAWLCLDGSQRSAPWLCMLVCTYASCIEIPCLRLFFQIERGYYVCFGDVDNAFQLSPPPSIQCYLRVDDEIEEYYLKKFGVKLDRLKDVIP